MEALRALVQESILPHLQCKTRHLDVFGSFPPLCRSKSRLACSSCVQSQHVDGSSVFGMPHSRGRERQLTSISFERSQIRKWGAPVLQELTLGAS
jgi:hypothetical protein